MMHNVLLDDARMIVRRAGFVPKVSDDESRLEVWRDGLVQGVKVGSTLIDRGAGVDLVSRHALARIMYGG
jgi:hypothetical protein